MARRRLLIILGCCAVCGLSHAAQSPHSFGDCKTIFQTNTGFDPRLGIAVDGVIVHRHAASFAGELDSWRQQGFAAGRMFFADSDAGNDYWKGKWDVTPHPQDVERDQAGNVVLCAGIRPYMLPTEGWIRYLEDMTRQSLAAGAEAILPEEPLAHVFTGYEESFKTLWQKRYGRPWQGQHESAEARFLTAQLKNELYIELERRLLEVTKKSAGSGSRTPAFILPIHSIYSNIAAQLVAPLGTSTNLPIDGYIGQIWTGPVNWALGHYDSPGKSFFGSAFVLYDFFTQLAVGSERKMWLLIDPVEDNPDHAWAEFREWYQHGVAAMLMMKDTDRYEIMPWPDRIFLPGYGTGGKTPAPENYRIVILSVTQVLQEVPLGGQWETTGEATIGEGIGVAMADTLMWQRHSGPWLQGAYGMLLPLVERGIPVSSVVLERAKEPKYLKRFKVIVLFYEDFKPADATMNESLAAWVKGGGSLIVLGKDGDELDRCENFWWHKQGFASPLAHLLSLLGDTKAASWKFGSGSVSRSDVPPRRFGNSTAVEQDYLPLVDAAWKQATSQSLSHSGNLIMRRGPFVICRAETKPVKFSGRLLDVFDPALNIHDGIELTPGQSGLFRDVQADIASGSPKVLHATHRLMSQSTDSGVLRFVVRGPAETPAVVRIVWPKDKPLEISATDPDGKSLVVSSDRDDTTTLLRFANHPQGVAVSCGTK